MEKPIIQKSANWDHSTHIRTRVLHDHYREIPILLRPYGLWNKLYIKPLYVDSNYLTLFKLFQCSGICRSQYYLSFYLQIYWKATDNIQFDNGTVVRFRTNIIDQCDSSKFVEMCGDT